MKRLLLIGCFCLMGWISLANHILIPMDNTQSNHLKAYGVVCPGFNGTTISRCS